MTRARTPTKDMREDLMKSLAALRAYIQADPGPEGEMLDHLATVETFCAVALRVFAKTNPSKIASEARTVEISTMI
jgi:hypothetical protein